MKVTVNGSPRDTVDGQTVARLVAELTEAGRGAAERSEAGRGVTERSEAGRGVTERSEAGRGAAERPEARRGVAVAVNGEVVPRSEWSVTRLADGDHVEVLAATQGG